MSGIVEWARQYSMVFLLLTIITSAAAKKEYRTYIRLFVEIILVITLCGPLFLAFGKTGDLFEKISFDSFWQGLENINLDREKMDFLNEDYYISYYEKAIEADLGLLARNAGYAVLEAKVKLNEAFGVEELRLKVAKDEDNPVISGTIGTRPEAAELTALRKKIAACYQIEEERISILD